MDDIPSRSEEFLIEQFRQLQEEIRALNRFAWQLPLGVLGAIGLCLSGLYALAKSLPSTGAVVSAGLIVAGVITFGFLFLLGRFHTRRGFRREEARKIQSWYQERNKDWPRAETLPLSSDITRYATNREKGGKKATNRVFGRWETTSLGVALLFVIAFLLTAAGVIALFFLAQMN